MAATNKTNIEEENRDNGVNSNEPGITATSVDTTGRPTSPTKPSSQPPSKIHKKNPPTYSTISIHNGNTQGRPEKAPTLLDLYVKSAEDKQGKIAPQNDDDSGLNLQQRDESSMWMLESDEDKKPAAKSIATGANPGCNKQELKLHPNLRRPIETFAGQDIRTGFTENMVAPRSVMRVKFQCQSNVKSLAPRNIITPRRIKFKAPDREVNEIIEIDSDTEQSPTMANVTQAAPENVDMTTETYRHMGLTTLRSPMTSDWEARMDRALQINTPVLQVKLYLQQLLKAPPGTEFSTVAFSVPPHTNFQVIPPSSHEQQGSLQWLDKKYQEEVHPYTFYDNVTIATHRASLIPADVHTQLTKPDATGACLVRKNHQYDSIVVQALLEAVPLLVRFDRQVTTKILTLYKFDKAKVEHLITRIQMSAWYIAKERTPALPNTDRRRKPYDRHTEFLYNLLDFAYPINAQSIYTAESETLWYIPRQIADWVILFPKQVSDSYYRKRLQNSFVPPQKADELYHCK